MQENFSPTEIVEQAGRLKGRPEICHPDKYLEPKLNRIVGSLSTDDLRTKPDRQRHFFSEASKSNPVEHQVIGFRGNDDQWALFWKQY